MTRVYKRLLAALTALVMALALLPATAVAIDPEVYGEYNTATGEFSMKSNADYTVISKDTALWNEGWYVASGAVTINSRVIVTGNVHLILKNGCELTINGGILVDKLSSLTIYGQDKDTGELITDGGENGGGAGIGGDGGNISIHGGTITATGDNGGAGIGGGEQSTGGGEKSTGGEINIYGGTITKAWGGGGAGIGGGSFGNCGNINISGGTITKALGSVGAAGIGGGIIEGGGKINISGSANIVLAQGGEGGEINISGEANITKAQGGTNAAGVGGGMYGSGGTINISGGSLTSEGGDSGAGIGGGMYGDGGTITITGGTILKAAGGNSGAGIGGGDGSGGGAISISGGMILKAEGGYSAAGIGGGYKGSAGTISISGGSLTSVGGGEGADIGCGNRGSGGGKVTITGGNVCAQSDKISPAPTDGSQAVYRVTLTLVKDDKVTLVDKDTVIRRFEEAANYGFRDVVTLPGGLAYFYLPESYELSSVNTVGGAKPTSEEDVYTSAAVTVSADGLASGTFIKTSTIPIPFGDEIVFDIALGEVEFKDGGVSGCDVDGFEVSTSDLKNKKVIIIQSNKAEPTANTVRVVNKAGSEYNVTLRGVNISSASGAAFSITGGASVLLSLDGENTLRGSPTCAGLNVPEGASVTISAKTGDAVDSLSAIGGEYSGSIGGGAGIGGGFGLGNGAAVAEGELIKSFETDATGYGLNDVRTLSGGRLYFYLPESQELSSLTTKTAGGETKETYALAKPLSVKADGTAAGEAAAGSSFPPFDPPYVPPETVSVSYYRLSFDTRGGSALRAILRAEDTEIGLNKYVPARAGYDFTGWYADEALTVPLTSIRLYENTTIYAGWRSQASMDNLRLRAAEVLALIEGIGGEAAEPDAALTLGEVLKIACTIRSIYAGDEYAFPLTEPWYETYVNYAVANDIIAADDFADYGAVCTRAAAAYILVRALPAELPALSSLTPPDVALNDRYGREIYALYAAGILSGLDETHAFGGEAAFTRAHAAAIAARLCRTGTR